VGGFVNYFQPKFALKVMPPSEIRFRHNLFGLVTFSLGMGAIYLGYYSKFFTKFVDNDFIPGMMLITAMVYVLTIIAPVSSLLTKLKYRIQEEGGAGPVSDAGGMRLRPMRLTGNCQVLA